VVYHSKVSQRRVSSKDACLATAGVFQRAARPHGFPRTWTPGRRAGQGFETTTPIPLRAQCSRGRTRGAMLKERASPSETAGWSSGFAFGLVVSAQSPRCRGATRSVFALGDRPGAGVEPSSWSREAGRTPWSSNATSAVRAFSSIRQRFPIAGFECDVRAANTPFFFNTRLRVERVRSSRWSNRLSNARAV